MISFNVYEDGKVQVVTLEVGEHKEFPSGGPTDEGYHWALTRYEFDGQTVTATHSWHGRDCDGTHNGGSERVCGVGELADYVSVIDEVEVAFPNWVTADEFHRDHTAEAAGY